MRKIEKIFSVFIALLISVLTLSICVGSSTFVIGSPDTPQVTVESSQFNGALDPLCYNARSGKEYYDLFTALDEAVSGDYVYVYLGKQINNYDTLTVKEGVHFVLPIAGKSVSSDTRSPVYDVTDPSNIGSYGNSKQGDTSSLYKTYRKCLINMISGSDLIVETGGFLHLGGVFSTNGNLGWYSEINLRSGSHIECDGTFDCYGYVKEYVSDALNPKYSYKPATIDETGIIDNSKDAERYVLMKENGVLNSYMAMQDALTGGGLATCIQAGNVCPFHTYDFPAIQTYLKFEYGSTFSIGAVMKVGDETARGNGMIISPSSNSSTSLFKMNSGSLVFEYMPVVKAGVSYTNKAAGLTNIVIDGETTLKSLEIDVEGQSINTADFFVPLSYKQLVHITSGGVFNVNSKLKCLNESEIHINNGGTLNVNHEMIVYNKTAVAVSGSTKYTHNSKDALLEVNGTLKLNADNSGKSKLGAVINHSSTENSDDTLKGKIDLVDAPSGSLSVTAIEDNNGHEVSVATEGTFIRDNADHSQGVGIGKYSLTETYYSGYDSSFAEEEQYYWVGTFVEMISIEVTVESSTYLYPYKYYTLKNSTASSGSNPETLAENASTTLTYTVQRNTYINLAAPNVGGVALTINGTSMPYSESTWYKAEGNIEAIITPAKGYKVILHTTGQQGDYHNGTKIVTKDTTFGNSLGCDDNTDSGRGSTNVQILASTNSTSGFTVVNEGTGQTDFTMSGNSYYRLYCDSAGTNSKFNTIEFTGKYYDYDGVSKTGTVNSGFVLTNQTQSNNHTFAAEGTPELRAFTFGFLSDQTECLLPDTLITMSNGYKKPIKDIKEGEMVKVFNHEEGKIDKTPVIFNEKEEADEYNVIYLDFDNGKRVGVIYEHGFFDLDTNRYEYINEKNYLEFIGHRFFTEDYKETKLVNSFVRKEYTETYSFPSYYHLNSFTEGILSMPGGISGLFNIFEYDENLKYDEDKYLSDISTYGLMTLEELASYGVNEEMYNAYPAKYLKVALGKGIMTEEQLKYLINRYGKYTS